MTRELEELEALGVDPLALRARSERTKYGVTQREFAHACGIDQATLINFELGKIRGQKKFPRGAADATRAKIAALLSEWENNPPTPRPDMRGRWNFAREALKSSRQ